MRYISSCAYIINNSFYLLEEFESSRALVIQCLKGLKISFLKNYKANTHVTHINGNLSAVAGNLQSDFTFIGEFSSNILENQDK